MIAALALLASLATAEPAVARTFLTVDGVDPSTTASVRHWCGVAHAALQARVRRVDDVAAEGDAGASAAAATVHAATVVAVAGAPRFVHRVALSGLVPGATYAVVLVDGDVVVAPERRFRALPARGAVRVVVGGDVMPTVESRALAAHALRRDPDLLVLGGDLAYDNGDPAEVALVDDFVAFLVDATTTAEPTPRLVPVVAAIGNHEALRDMDLAVRPRALHGAPFYDALFLDGRASAATYRAVLLSDVAALLLLDSGHVEPHAGAQTAWLDATLALTGRRPFRLAAYHTPLYPSVRPMADLHAVAGRAAWEHRFVAGGVAAAFEHHDHALKRTRPLVAGRDAADGVVYLGDGSFGRPPRAVRADLDDRFVTALAAMHVWVVDVRADHASARAIGPTGDVLDEVVVRPRAHRR